MRDGEYLFHLSQRENRHSGAFHKRNGSKSKKCSLPSDNLTAKQRKELNGPMKTYNLKKPMKWEEFKDMPNDLKKEYLLFLNDEFHANGRKIALMMEVSQAYFSRKLTELGIALVGYKQHEPTWEKFLGGGIAGRESSTGTEEPAEEESAPAEPTLPDRIDSIFSRMDERPYDHSLLVATEPELVVSEISMTAVGTAEDLAFLLKSSLRSDKHYRLSFTAALQEVHEA